MVRLHRATYVYIPHLLNTPYNANKSIFVYLHGFFTSIYIYNT
nr:MAG TPA: BioH protein [Caudoviricetes sp.]